MEPILWTVSQTLSVFCHQLCWTNIWTWTEERGSALRGEPAVIHWVFDESDSAQYLVPDNLLLRHSVEPLNVSDDDGHDEVDHDDGAEDDESH